MRIGELSKASGVPARTIRFYEERGILPEPERTDVGYRDYDGHAVNRLGFLRAAQEAGLTLAEIQSIIAIRDDGDAPCTHTRQLLEAKRDDVSSRLRQLRELLTELDQLIESSSSIRPEECEPNDICSIIPNVARRDRSNTQGR